MFNYKEIINKGKRFVNKHKEELILGAVTAGAFVLGACAINASKKGSAAPAKLLSKIDEDIFTRLAPEIKGFVMTEGLNEGFIERVYTLVYPKYGDESQGTYEVKKQVQVLIRDMCDQEE